MSTTWYECKVKYRKLDDNGVQKVTTEPYLVDAVSYTEAESRITEEMAMYISEEFMITNIKMANFAEIHPFENSDRWFKILIVKETRRVYADLVSTISTANTTCVNINKFYHLILLYRFHFIYCFYQFLFTDFILLIFTSCILAGQF